MCFGKPKAKPAPIPAAPKLEVTPPPAPAPAAPIAPGTAKDTTDLKKRRKGTGALRIDLNNMPGGSGTGNNIAG